MYDKKLDVTDIYGWINTERWQPEQMPTNQ